MAQAWLTLCLDALATQPVCGYALEQSPAAEPTALSALALAVHGLPFEASLAADWLVEIQAESGSVGVRAESPEPRWPTSLAMLAWGKLASEGESNQYERPLALALGGLLSIHGESQPNTPETGHDTTLIGWPWVESTHSWLEPTALAVLALKSQGMRDNPRTQQAVRLLADRLLPAGGCNYGNTIVLSQTLLPHVQPSGMVLTALAGEGSIEETDAEDRIERTRAYLRRNVNDTTTAASLAWALLGLASHGERTEQASDWLAAAATRTLARDGSPYKLALLALAAAEPPVFPLVCATAGPASNAASEGGTS